MSELNFLPSKKPYLKGKTLFITGGSRGIGRAIALRAAIDGANVVIVAKTITANPKLPGTIFSVAEEIENLGGRALPIQCDIRDEKQIQEALDKAMNEYSSFYDMTSRFGAIDIVINNASAISLTSSEDTSMKKYDLMHDINVRGSFATAKLALPFLKLSKNPHILNLSPPIDLNPEWFAPHVAYTMSKYGMSMVVTGLSAEFKDFGIAVNALWPQTVIATDALKAFAGDAGSICDPLTNIPVEELSSRSRHPAIMADAAYCILNQEAASFTGTFFIDEDVLFSQGLRSLERYSITPGTEPTIDLFVKPSRKRVIYQLTNVMVTGLSKY